MTEAKPSAGEKAEKRFWSRVNKGPECWLWVGGKGSAGYGQFYFEGRLQMAHRISWAWQNGRIEKGLVIDHTCRVRACVNPSHLRVVTQQVNGRENTSSPHVALWKANKCAKGHELTEDNAYLTREKGIMRKRCRECNRIRLRKSKAKRRERTALHVRD